MQVLAGEILECSRILAGPAITPIQPLFHLQNI
eukprot:COSAG05_NODE_15172_length_376_cov_1.310469_1_plen_32_part_10